MSTAHAGLMMIGENRAPRSAQSLQFRQRKTFTRFGGAQIEVFGFKSVVWVEKHQIAAFERLSQTPKPRVPGRSPGRCCAFGRHRLSEIDGSGQQPILL